MKPLTRKCLMNHFDDDQALLNQQLLTIKLILNIVNHKVRTLFISIQCISLSILISNSNFLIANDSKKICRKFILIRFNATRLACGMWLGANFILLCTETCVYGRSNKLWKQQTLTT